MRLKSMSNNIGRRLIHTQRRRSPLAFAFDIDGVLIHEPSVLPAAKRALAILNGENKQGMKIPYIMMTNGGGSTEVDRVARLSAELGVPVYPSQMVQSHTVLRSLSHKYADEPVLVLGGINDACVARARIPTVHGPAFLHLYHNNRDAKEHLAIVMDPAQLSAGPMVAPPVRSASLDSVWDEETTMDRLIRGAYTGRLAEDVRTPSDPPSDASRLMASASTLPPPLVHIHSECYTGVSQTIPGRGAVIYLRQEGRGIGLASKLRAYNLQDMGHDTLSANLELGHGADECTYEVDAAILRDLGLIEPPGSTLNPRTGIRLLTNNPAKLQAMSAAGINILDRVEMVPPQLAIAARGVDLDKYIKAKVEKMGHMLSVPISVRNRGDNAK
ncbi:hypothetical protein N7447_003937 [Penicillium robsamsonii]|uniref:uncharacterized protein n=1 Tax=Penicillium robsamsonii TaxID=1792511 RepID=UPI0025474E69|nr:uncharacterized protein N7447_003937 [Penicillium robsamsonii]KAJ5827174.1 hypothetical protein N7447_003937 [Penicillium robsamsonii]